MMKIRPCRTGYDTLAIVPAEVGKSGNEDWEAVDSDCGETDVQGGFAGETDDGNGRGGQEWTYHKLQRCAALPGREERS